MRDGHLTMRRAKMDISPRYIPGIGNGFRCPLARRHIHRLIAHEPVCRDIPRSAIPWCSRVQKVCSTACRIERQPHGINQNSIRRLVLDTLDDELVEKVLADQPARSGQWRHYNIDLPNAGHAVSVARVGTVVVPRSPVFRSVLFYRDLTERSKVPLRAVGRVPPERLEAAPPVGSGF